MKRPNRLRGFTLIELIIVVVIAMILVTTTTPSLQTLIQNNRLVSVHNDLVSDLALTRSTAVTRGNHAVLCASNPEGNWCNDNTQNWKNGWLIFDDINSDGIRIASEPIISVNSNHSEQVQIIASNSQVSYDSDGTAFGSAAEFAFCDQRGETSKRGLVIMNSGASRSANADEIGINCE